MATQKANTKRETKQEGPSKDWEQGYAAALRELQGGDSVQNQAAMLMPQNDIADGLYWLAKLIGGEIGAMLAKLADFFEGLDGDEVHAMNESCGAVLIDGVKMDAMEALANLLSDLLLRVQEFLSCYLGGTEAQLHLEKSQVREMVAEKLNLGCLWKATTTYFATKDVIKTILAYFTCAGGFGGDTGGGGDAGGGGGLPFHDRPVKRC